MLINIVCVQVLKLFSLCNNNNEIRVFLFDIKHVNKLFFSSISVNVIVASPVNVNVAFLISQ